MQYWMDSNQVEGICIDNKPSFETTSDVAPCTPMLPIYRQKPQGHETPGSSDRLPSLFLDTGSSERQKKSVTLNRPSQAPIVTYMSKSQPSCLQQLPGRSVQSAASRPSKNLQRIQLEVQRDGPELHKENLLSLSLPKHDRQLPVSQSSEFVLASGQCLGQPPPKRVPAGLGTSKLSFAEVITSHEAHFPQSTQPMGGYMSRSTLLPGIGTLQLMKPVNVMAKNSSVPVFEELSDSEQLSHLAKPSMVGHPIVGEETARCTSQGNPEIKCMSGSMDNRNLCQGLSKSYSTTIACTDLCLPVEQDLSLDNGMQQERAMFRQLLSGAPAQEQQRADGKGDNWCGNLRKRSSSLPPHDDSTSGDSQENGKPDVFLAKCPQDRKELRNLKRKQPVEQLKPSTNALEAADQSAQLCGKPQWSGGFVLEFSEQLKLPSEDNECKNLGVATWRGIKEKQGESIKMVQGECAASQLSPIYGNKQQNCSGLAASPSIVQSNGSSLKDSAIMRHVGGISSDLAGKFKTQSVGLKLFATPAYAQMPKALSTFSAGEPSLPLSLEVSGKLQDVRAGKTPINLGSTTDADWGKFLALSATPMGNKAETQAYDVMPFQQRFRQLQAFLKQCDESDQTERLQALRSLSAAARSCHAVELETRAIRLSLEEGKEMKRMKLLNVLCKIPDRSLEDVGATPQGPRLPAPGATSKYKQSS